MNSLSAANLSARLCTICLNTVVDDNSRGKAELVCGHLFHLDCIGSEFNYRNEMKCPNCRVVESGEWLIPDEEDIDDDEEIPMQGVNNRRFDLHIYSHGGRAREQNGGEEGRSPAAIASPTVHYHNHHHHHHNNNIVVPSGATSVVYGGGPPTMLRTFGNPQPPQGSDAGQRVRVRVDHVVLPDTSSSRPNVGDMRTRYHGAPAPAPQQHNSAAQTAGYNGPSLGLRPNSNPAASEDRANEDQPGTSREATEPHGPRSTR